MTRNQIIALKILAAVFLVAMVAQAADAHEPERVRKGFFLGADLGVGGAGVEYEVDGKQYESKDDYKDLLGGGMTLRLGYQFAPWFGLSIDGRGFGVGREDDHVLAIASSTLMGTFYPGNGGFFIRFGLGVARVHVEVPDDLDPDESLAREFEEDGGIAAFGLGYEWMVNDHYSLGFAFDTRGGGIDDLDGITDIKFGEATFGVSMNYFF
jgi:hypothetical protein